MSVMRRCLAGSAGLLAAAGLVITPMGSAAAVGRCSISGPTKISIDRPFREVTYRLGSCPSGAHANWDLIHPRYGATNSVFFDGSRSESMDVYSWNVKLGTSSLRPSMAFGADFTEDLSQNTLPVTMKAGSLASLATSRKGSTVTLVATTKNYRLASDTFRPRTSTNVTFQTRACPSCAWKSVKTVRTNAKGQAAATAKAVKAIQWRVTTPETSTVWASTSSAQRR